VLLYGDMPLLTAESLELLCTEQASTKDGMALLTAQPANPRGFGCIVRGADDSVARIVEEKDATTGERTLREVNLGVYCFDAASGDLVWSHDVMKDNAGVQIKWQNAASPVIDGNVLMMCGGGPGQALLGFDKTSGKILWKGEDDKMTHATPVVAELHGTRQCIFFTQKGLVAVLPESGKVLWRQPYRFNVSTAASPVVFEDIVYCSAGYGVGAGAYQISKDWKSKEIWRKETDEYANHWSTPVVKDGHLYGMFSFKKYGEGPLACVDIRTGEMKWATPGFGPGQVILSGDNIIALSDKGELVVVEAKPGKYTELKREEVLDGKVWSYPVLAYNRLFARSTTEGVCLEFQ